MKLDDKIFQIVRGQAHWSILRTFGIEQRQEIDRCTWHIPFLIAKPIMPKVSDVATGILKLSVKPNELREWASFLLAASSLVTFDELEKSRYGESLINVLWDISSGNYTEDEVRQIAELSEHENE